MLPTPYKLFLYRSLTGETDPHGNVKTSFGDPEELLVHAVAPGPSPETVAAGRNPHEVAWTVYAPEGTVVHAHDLIYMDGVEYEVMGDSKTFAFAPWETHISGVTIELKKQEG